MQLVDHDTFLKQLTSLFNSSKDQGTIWLTHKRLVYNDRDVAMRQEDSSDTRDYPCLVRVTDGDKTSFSTTVDYSQLDKFHAAYGTLLKASMTTLRKRDKKREKQRLEQAARRKKKMTETFTIEGPKRGNGRKKRQRMVKAAIKQHESQKKFEKREDARQEVQ